MDNQQNPAEKSEDFNLEYKVLKVEINTLGPTMEGFVWKHKNFEINSILNW